MKKCKKCGKTKDAGEYYKTGTGGVSNVCKGCILEKGLSRNRTKDGLIQKTFNQQRQRSRRNGFDIPRYSFNELRNWLLSQPLFHKTYDNWVSSNYQKMLIPSVDRLNDYKGYSLDNIQLISWEENKAKAHKDRVNGVNNKGSKAVVGVNIKNGDRKEYHSQCEAGRDGFNQGWISMCCLGKTKTHKGYYWRYL